jgi:nitrite reductase/ring-hydroxylating ferredoxin subunit
MSEGSSEPTGPDLSTDGLAVDEIGRKGMAAGHVGGDAVLVARVGDEYLAIGATCTHYGGPLAEGLLVGDEVRCPWHHACFSLRTGEALRAPAFEPLSRWRAERKGDRIFVHDKEPAAAPAKISSAAANGIGRIAIVGGGAAGFACADMLRRRGFTGDVTIFSDDPSPPPDRPNLSKDYLAGKAPEDWIPLRPPEFYEGKRIALRLDTGATAIDPARQELALAGGGTVGYDRLLLATGAEPVKLDVPGGDLPHVHRLRSVGDCRAIIADAEPSRRAVVSGAS